MTQTEIDFVRRLSAMGLALTEDQLAGFRTYYENLTEWNRVMNLTAITGEEDVYTKHFLDCLSLVRIVSRETLRGKRMIDVGTGAGFPGLVLAIAFPEMEVVLMDSLNKRIRFLDDTVEKLGLSNVRTIHARAEELARDKRHRETYDLCCSRAVASAAVLSEYCLPFIRKGGLFAAYKSEKAEQELISMLVAGMIPEQLLRPEDFTDEAHKALAAWLIEGRPARAYVEGLADED